MKGVAIVTDEPINDLLRAFEKIGVMPLFDDENAEDIATQLDSCVDDLVLGVARQPSAYAHAMYVDLMMGLALTAESLRTRVRGEEFSAWRFQASASEYLGRVRLEEIVLDDFGLSDGSIWD